MEIRLGSLVRDAQEAQGTTIIIDVFRAFTTAAIAFGRGAKEITLVAEPEEAMELHRRGVGDYLMGEVGGKRPEGFDFLRMGKKGGESLWRVGSIRRI